MSDNVAYLFPGQGSQYVGMGKELYDSSKVAQEIFHKANEALGFELTKLLFEGPEEELKSTINCQPAILVHSIAMLKALQESEKSKSMAPAFMAGLSLGEYSALIASGVFQFEEGLRLVRKRAQLMEEESVKNPGKMAAVIGLEAEKVKEACSKTGAEIANLNCPGQIVITGTKDAVDAAKEQVTLAGAKTVVDLQVSGAFHSSLMKTAGERLADELVNVSIVPSNPPVISNVTAQPQEQPDEIRANLKEQVSHSVMWEDSMRFLVSQGVTKFLEIGPNKVLRGLMRRIDPALKVHTIEKPQDLETLL
ncbi:ACP S-malonyltransferase [Candidatus Omnitrophota bacterium]